MGADHVDDALVRNAKPVIVVFLRHFILHASIACMRHLAEERIVSLPDKSPAGANVVALAGGPGASAPPTFGRTAPAQCGFAALRQRSEEPTSELQSLMRISYAVFC